MKKNNVGHAALRRGRTSIAAQVYHLTSVTAGREALFLNWSLGRLVAPLLNDASIIGDARTLAWVLMPDHLHWLLQLGATHRLTDIVRRLKSASAVRINRTLQRSGPVWTPAFHDRALRQEEDVRDVARYIIANPLGAGLVRSLGEYPLWDAVWLQEQVASKLAPTEADLLL